MRPKYSSPGAETFICVRMYCCHFESFDVVLLLWLLAGVFFGCGCGAGAAATDAATARTRAAAHRDVNARFNKNPFCSETNSLLGTYFTVRVFAYSRFTVIRPTA